MMMMDKIDVDSDPHDDGVLFCGNPEVRVE